MRELVWLVIMPHAFLTVPLYPRSVIDNVCYNGPRAHFNINDGFYGQNWIEGNVLFNAVRETGDHGPINT